MNAVNIGKSKIGCGLPCFIVGEVAQAHEGSLGMAHAFIDAIARAGADAVKFQTHIADRESSPLEPWRVKFSLQDDTRLDYWRRMEFTPEQWKGLKEHAENAGLVFISSPFSFEALDLLCDLGMTVIKMASGELDNIPMLEYAASKKLPMLISSGMSSIADVDNAVAIAEKHAAPYVLMQCTSAYPCPPEKIGLNMLSYWKEKYDCPVGLSDHSGTIWPGVAAVSLGCDILEVHVAFSREMFGPDVPASLTPEELKKQVDGIRYIEQMLNNPVDKDKIYGETVGLRDIFGKSIVAARNLPAGHILTMNDLTFRKPGNGIAARRYEELLGCRIISPLAEGAFLREDDFDNS